MPGSILSAQVTQKKDLRRRCRAPSFHETTLKGTPAPSTTGRRCPSDGPSEAAFFGGGSLICRVLGREKRRGGKGPLSIGKCGLSLPIEGRDGVHSSKLHLGETRVLLSELHWEISGSGVSQRENKKPFFFCSCTVSSLLLIRASLPLCPGGMNRCHFSVSSNNQ